MIKKPWTKLEEEYLVNARHNGVSYSEIAKELKRSTTSVLMKGSRLMTESMRTRDNIRWSTDEVHKLISMHNEGFCNKEIATALNRTDTAVRHHLAKLAKQGLIANPSNSLDGSKETTVYLLHFVEEDFYKIGLTQQSIQARFSGYPKFSLLDSVVLEDLDSARDLEAELLSKIEPYTPSCFGKHHSGKSECFKNRVSTLLDLI